MPYGTINADLMTTSDGVSSSGLYGFKNRIINGAMVIDQRNAGASVTVLTSTGYSLDRWRFSVSQSSKLSFQQNAGSVTPPVGFSNYLGITSLSAYSVTAGDYFALVQSIEGFNTADLNWGTANAKTVTLSFQVYSSLTGTFGGTIQNSANNRSYPFSYTVTSANTWTPVSITVAGDTTGTWIGATNGTGMTIRFALGFGSTYGSGTAGAWVAGDVESVTGATSVVGTNGATFYITGVQLEKGSTATSFDYRPYGTELALCQRYYYRISPNATNAPFSMGGNYSTTLNRTALNFPVTMRIAPTALEQTGTASDYSISQAGIGGTVCSAVPAFSLANFNFASFNGTVASGLTANLPSLLVTNSTSSYLAWSAEL